MQQYTVIIGIGISVIATMAIIFGMDVAKLSVSTQDYDIFVDPLLDKQNLFVVGRVTIQNIGHLPLTNVQINFGDGDTQRIGTLDVGKKIIVSPPPGNSMNVVIVSADNGVIVSKNYREMPKMVGMMGS